MRSGVRFLLLASAGCAVVFTALLVGVYYTEQGRWLDNAALEGFVSAMSVGLLPLASAVASLCDPVPFAAISLGLIGIALVRREPRRAAAAATLLFGSAATTQLLKPAIAHPRFDGFVVSLHGHAVNPYIPAPAFPSGHATAAMAIALAALIVVPRALRPLTAACGAVFALTIGCTIVALGWHFPSDIVGGYLVATAWGLATLAGLRAADARWPAIGTLRAVARSKAPAVREALAPAAALVAIAVVAVAVARFERIAAFAGAHTTTTLAAIAIAMCSATLVAVVSLADQRGH
jgi:membrane-associated phospholipid phosphatase